jgi:hypothetical protein
MMGSGKYCDGLKDSSLTTCCKKWNPNKNKVTGICKASARNEEDNSNCVACRNISD